MAEVSIIINNIKTSADKASNKGISLVGWLHAKSSTLNAKLDTAFFKFWIYLNNIQLF